MADIINYRCVHCQKVGWRRHEVLFFDGLTHTCVCLKCGDREGYRYVGLDYFHNPKFRIVGGDR